MNRITIFILCAVMFAPASFAAKPTTVSIMTFNIENGGTQVDFNKLVEAVHISGADVVGIQEAWGHTERLAKALHWKYFSAAQHIASRFPLLEPIASHHRYIFVEVTPGKVVAMANMHLPDEPYGPSLVSAGVSMSDVQENERRVRLPTALPFIKALSSLAKTGMPVFLTGDFNSPSHLDEALQTPSEKPWVVTMTAADFGLKDSFRTMFPDPIKTPGYTWPAGRPFIKSTIDGYNPSDKDTPTRIDYVFFGGAARVRQSRIIAEAGSKHAAMNVTPWPSDHAAVVSTFSVTPMKLQNGIYIKPNHAQKLSVAKPVIFLSKTFYQSGEPITISWKNAPGNRYDFIRIVPVGSAKSFLENSARQYTQAKVNGSIQYNASNVNGNWHDWNKSKEEYWPLQPGNYDVDLVLDDSQVVIASMQIGIE